MNKIALFAILLISTAAYAQEDAEAKQKVHQAAPAPVAPSTLPAPVTHWVLDLDQSDLVTINQCVGDLPFRIANPFVQKMNQNLKPAVK